VDRLSERPNCQEGSASTRAPRCCCHSASLHGKRSRHRRQPSSLRDVHVDRLSLPPRFPCAATRSATSFPTGTCPSAWPRLVPCCSPVRLLPAARSLPLTTLHLASP